MKKQYINPAMEIVNIELKPILTMSNIDEVTNPLSREFDELDLDL